MEVLNREIGARFNKDEFEHYACYNVEENRIEMYLMSMEKQAVKAGELGREIHFDEGEAILTEISRKFTKKSLENLLGEGEFDVLEHYEATENPFSLVLASPQ